MLRPDANIVASFDPISMRVLPVPFNVLPVAAALHCFLRPNFLNVFAFPFLSTNPLDDRGQHATPACRDLTLASQPASQPALLQHPQKLQWRRRASGTNAHAVVLWSPQRSVSDATLSASGRHCLCCEGSKMQSSLILRHADATGTHFVVPLWMEAVDLLGESGPHPAPNMKLPPQSWLAGTQAYPSLVGRN